MEWGWVIGGLVVFAGFGMWKTARRNNDPIYHHLLFLLFSAAEVTDDIYDECFEMQQFLAEVRKMQALDGGLKMGRKFAHLATMIPYYGNASPLVQSRAKSIVDRIVRNGVPESQNYGNRLRTGNASGNGVNLVGVDEGTGNNSTLFDKITFENEINSQLGIDDSEFRKIFQKHIKVNLRDFEANANLEPSAQLVIMRRAAARKNQKKAPKLSVKSFKVGKDALLVANGAVASASTHEIIEARDLAAFSLVKKQPFNNLPDFVVRAMLTASLLHLTGIEIENHVSMRKTPICYCLYDSATDRFVFFVTRSVNGQTQSVFAEVRDFSCLL